MHIKGQSFGDMMRDRNMRDKQLIKRVHCEINGDLTIHAIITSLGSLGVTIVDEIANIVWSGDNILKARQFCDDYDPMKKEENDESNMQYAVKHKPTVKPASKEAPDADIDF